VLKYNGSLVTWGSDAGLILPYSGSVNSVDAAFGVTNSNGPGLFASSSGDGNGIVAYSASGNGVKAMSTNDVGVYATAGSIPLILVTGRQGVVGQENGSRLGAKTASIHRNAGFIIQTLTGKGLLESLVNRHTDGVRGLGPGSVVSAIRCLGRRGRRLTVLDRWCHWESNLLVALAYRVLPLITEPPVSRVMQPLELE
jgi:hypothetical protein